MAEFDPSEYTRAPVISVSGGIALARALLKARPPGMPAGVEKSARKLGLVADAAQEVLALRQRAAAEGEGSTREVDGDADASWSALRMRLHAYALLPDRPHDRARRARQLLVTLFGDDGLAFLRERYPVQYTVADTILKRIDGDGLQAEIDDLAGREFLANVRVQHERYGGMVQGVLMREQAGEEDLREHQRRLQRAITAYAISVCATVDEDDPASIERVHVALKPLMNYRQYNLRGRGSAEPGGKPAGPQQSGEPVEPA
jgi:hypothetical protein